MTHDEIANRLSVYAIVPVENSLFEAVAALVAASQMRMVATRPFAAIVGDGIETAGHSREELMPLLLTYQRLIEQILRVSPVLPVRFGTLVCGEDDVREMLLAGEAQIAAAFEQVAGCVQMEVVARWDTDATFAEIAKEDAIAGLKQMWSAHPDEALRLAIGDKVKQSLELRRSDLARSLLQALRAVAHDAIAYPPMDDRVVLQAALLVRSDELLALDDVLEDLDATHGGRLSFRLVGPQAPCCFATIEMEMIAPVMMEHAMDVLSVGPGAGAMELRQAYHRAVKAAHPDIAGDAATGVGVAELTEAYRVLSLCAGAGQGHRTIVVAAKRQEPHFDVAA